VIVGDDVEALARLVGSHFLQARSISS
jgi:hypothetical protein